MFKTKQIKFVSTYFTPFAIMLVLTGTVFAKIDTKIALIAIAIIAFTLVFNLTTEDLSKKTSKNARILGNTRLLINFTMNVFLLYLLGMYWKPIWLLFVLSPVAIAVYSTTSRTILACIITAIVLLLIYFVKGLSGFIAWGEVINYILFIFVLSLFVNNLAKSIRAERK